MDKASVTSPIDFLKNRFEAVYGGYGQQACAKFRISELASIQFMNWNLN